jgi:hypothetical protein
MGEDGKETKTGSILLPLEESRSPFSEYLYLKITDRINLIKRNYMKY